MKHAAFSVTAALCLFASACGYHVAGRETVLPKTIHIIAIPAIENKTTSYRVEQKLTAATIHEFLAKTNYKIVSNPASADAVLSGKVLSVEAVPLTFQTQPQTSTTSTITQATTMLVTVKCEVTLTESDSQKVLFHSDNFLFRNEYELSTDVKSFFEEQDPALDRLAKDFAQKLVVAILENF
jgi:outer membrane lipopolysaccharide assembly protein LptE/RlpB